MDYYTADRAPRRIGPDIAELIHEADECIVLDFRGKIRPSDMVEQRLQCLLGKTPLNFGEKNWHFRSRYVQRSSRKRWGSD